MFVCVCVSVCVCVCVCVDVRDEQYKISKLFILYMKFADVLVHTTNFRAV